MNWLRRLFSRKRTDAEIAAATFPVYRAWREETEHLRVKMLACRERVAKYDGMGRLTHTQEILRAQAAAKAEAYGEFLGDAFMHSLVTRALREIER